MPLVLVPAEETARKAYLMQQLEKVRQIEASITKELRQLIYKIEKK
jgi:hypothetical protein